MSIGDGDFDSYGYLAPGAYIKGPVDEYNFEPCHRILIEEILIVATNFNLFRSTKTATNSALRTSRPPGKSCMEFGSGRIRPLTLG
jgi:hypothetical protein